MRAGEGAMPFKKRLGHSSATLESKAVIKGLSNTINKKWKAELTSKFKGIKFYSNVECTVFVNGTKFTLNGIKTPEKWANNLANLILRSRHTEKEMFGNAGATLRKAASL